MMTCQLFTNLQSHGELVKPPAVPAQLLAGLWTSSQ